MLDRQRKLRYSLLWSLTLFPRCENSVLRIHPEKIFFLLANPYLPKKKNTKVHIHASLPLLCLANFTNVKHHKGSNFEKWNVHNFQSWHISLPPGPVPLLISISFLFLSSSYGHQQWWSRDKLIWTLLLMEENYFQSKTALRAVLVYNQTAGLSYN